MLSTIKNTLFILLQEIAINIISELHIGPIHFGIHKFAGQFEECLKKSNVTKLNDGVTLKLDAPPSGQTYYMVGSEYYIQFYPRVLIKHRKAIK